MLDHLDEYVAASLADLGLYSDPQNRHSHPLALTQLLLVYHLLRAKQREESKYEDQPNGILCS